MKKNHLHSAMILVLATSCYSHAACNTNVPPTAPNSRYELLNGDSEVKDLRAGLIWQRCSLGQTWSGTSCTGTAATYNWTNTLQTAANMNNGWRVPNIKELNSLLEQACYRPSINDTYFPNTVSGQYWSSSPSASDSRNAWVVSFASGGSRALFFYGGYKGDRYYVRLVRSSQ